MSTEKLTYSREWTDAEAFPRLGFTKNWENPADYPTIETDEAKVRQDMQSLHDETKDYINEKLIPAILAEDATEEARIAAENAREANELSRVQAEQIRVANEKARIEAESARSAAEAGRTTAEEGRVKAEQARAAAEAARVQAEQARVDTNSGIVARATAQANAAANSAEHAETSKWVAKVSEGAAKASETAAGKSATESQSWAVGGTGTRAGENTNNAKYWSTVAMGAAGGGVTTFNGRFGAVVPQTGDYTAAMVGAAPESLVDRVHPMSGASKSEPGKSGFVPAPESGDDGKYLRGDGMWVYPSRAYADTMKGWRVCMIGDAYMVAHCSFSLSGLTVDTTTIPNNISKTGVLYLPVPFPVEYLTPLATCDRRGQYISSVNSVSGDAAVGFSYRIFDQTKPSAIESTVHFALMGNIKNPPVAPAKAYNAAAAAEIVSIAQSYVDARIAGRKFGYGANFFYGSATYPINDDTGAAMMECDTFVGMVLRGVRYDDSPFADTTPGLVITYDDMMANCKYSASDWCTTTRGLITGDTPHNVLGRDIKYADDLAWLAWSQKGRVFSDARNAMPGDLVFWKRPQKSTQFDNIGHVAILGDGGCIYEVTSAGSSGGEVIRKVGLEEKGEMPTYFARMY